MYFFTQDMYNFTYHSILIRLSEDEGWSWVPRDFLTYNAAQDYAYKYFRGLKNVKVVSAEDVYAAEQLRLKMNSELNLKPIEKKEWNGKFEDTELKHLEFLWFLIHKKGVFDDDLGVMVPITEPLPTVEVK